MVHQNVLQAIGNTPIVRLNAVTQGCAAEIYAKLEFTNPGGSIKDRIGYWMIEDAEKRGVLKPGGTVIEGTSGNTGVGLAIASAVKGYKCIFVLPDKMSQEKIRNLRAFGAKVVVTPTDVEPEDPRSYYQVSRRLARETPNSIYLNQYDNLSNRDCHYHTTGPEILKQFPDVDVIIAGIGTGGTICGIGRYFKEKKPSVKIVAVDPVGSIVFDKFKHDRLIPAKSYMIEGIGEDFFPGNYDFDVIDDMVQVKDQESFLMTRDILVKEGLYSGISSGCVVVGALRWVAEQGPAMKGKKVLVIFPDSGNRYLSKVYDDDWMREVGFLEKNSRGMVSDLMHALHIEPGKIKMAKQTEKVASLIELMRKEGISQIPVQDDKGWIKGVVTEEKLLLGLYDGKIKPSDTADALMDSKVEFVTPQDSIEKVSKLLSQGKHPLVTDPLHEGRLLAILTKIDLISFLGGAS
ncbi:MAG: pyridoxal-phosphate dependent enzyme [Bdellovibrionales bacterium]|nr:pyridoxal-phosphate dependent enzyme [Bdellovibrionales bacterium]